MRTVVRRFRGGGLQASSIVTVDTSGGGGCGERGRPACFPCACTCRREVKSPRGGGKFRPCSVAKTTCSCESCGRCCSIYEPPPLNRANGRPCWRHRRWVFLCGGAAAWTKRKILSTRCVACDECNRGGSAYLLALATCCHYFDLMSREEHTVVWIEAAPKPA